MADKKLIYKGIKSSKDATEFNFDSEKGIVTFYASVFNNKDSDGDIIAPTAFNKTLQHPERIYWYLNHNPKDERIGILTFQITAKGLFCTGKINMDSSFAQEVYKQYKFFQENNQPLEHSIGFEIIKRDDNKTEIITEIKLWEISTLTSWAANPMALTQNVKEMSMITDRMVFQNETFENKEIENSVFINCNLTNCNLDDCTLINCNCVNCDCDECIHQDGTCMNCLCCDCLMANCVCNNCINTDCNPEKSNKKTDITAKSHQPVTSTDEPQIDFLKVINEFNNKKYNGN